MYVVLMHISPYRVNYLAQVSELACSDGGKKPKQSHMGSLREDVKGATKTQDSFNFIHITYGILGWCTPEKKALHLSLSSVVPFECTVPMTW